MSSEISPGIHPEKTLKGFFQKFLQEKAGICPGEDSCRDSLTIFFRVSSRVLEIPLEISSELSPVHPRASRFFFILEISKVIHEENLHEFIDKPFQEPREIEIPEGILGDIPRAPLAPALKIWM